MARKKKEVKEPDTVEDLVERPSLPPVSVVTSELNLQDLFDKLREFENKVLLERLKVLERSIALLYKEQLNNRAMLKEIQQIVSYLSVAQEEVLSGMGLNVDNGNSNQQEVDEEDAVVDSKGNDKKWN